MSRPDVLWFGRAANEATTRELKNRELQIVATHGTVSEQQSASACAAVFNADPDNLTELTKVAGFLVGQMIDYGLRVDFVASEDAVLGELQRRLAADTLKTRNVFVRTAPEAHELAERIARHDPGPQPNLKLEVEVAENKEPLRDDDLPLFQRGFHHCKKIVLSELSGGRSDARVFSIHATLQDTKVGPWPQPYFVKLDTLEKVTKEASNYREFGAPFIPFGLRPGIQEVVLGCARGILIGDFVDRSESLWELARRNVAMSPIHALADITLGGWRNQAYAKDPVKASVALGLQKAGAFDPERFKPTYAEHARRHGVDRSIEDIWSDLLGLDQQYRVAPMHGDLHGENVRVREGQAIVIDLASVTHGPLTGDLAALETWFAFELPPGEDRGSWENGEWAKLAERLYAPAAFRHPPEVVSATSRYCWVSEVVRQIRQMGIAVQSCGNEYQAAVAVLLLRRCMWDDGCTADRGRRAFGYLLASKLVDDLVGRA